MVPKDENENEETAEDWGMSPGKLRLLKVLVVGMGLLIVVGTVVVVTTIIYRMSMRDETPKESAAVSPDTLTGVSAAGDPVDVRLPAGSRLVHSSLSDGVLLLTIERADGATELLLVDVATGDIRRTLRLRADD